MRVVKHSLTKHEGQPCPACHSDEKPGEKGILKLYGIKTFSLKCTVCKYKVAPQRTRENSLPMVTKIKISMRLHNGVNPYRKYRSGKSVENAELSSGMAITPGKSVRS